MDRLKRLNAIITLGKAMDFLKLGDASGVDTIECYWGLKAIKDFLSYRDKEEENEERKDSVYDVRYKPFYDAFDCLKHMKNHNVCEYVKYEGSFKNIAELGDLGAVLFDGKEYVHKTYKELFNEGVTFMDRSPFGREESADEYFARIDNYIANNSKE